MRGAPVLAPGSALTAVADALRSGASAEQAWRRVGVLVRDGVPTASSLRAVTGDGDAAAAVLAAARLAHALGASAAPVLDAVLSGMEQDADAAVRRDTALAGPVASARVLAWLPVLGLALGLALGVNPLVVLLDPGGGYLLLLGGAGASVLGRWWTARLVRGAAAAGTVTDRAGADGGVGPERTGVAAQGAGRRPGGRMRALAGAAPGAAPTVAVTVVLDLVAAACEAGASVPGTLSAVGAAVPGRRGLALVDAGARLVAGAPWVQAWSDRAPELAPVAAALRPAWEAGVSPVAAARGAARALRRDHQASALAAAERLGVQLLLPLTLCHLPAFVLVGIAPLLASLVGPSGVV